MDVPVAEASSFVKYSRAQDGICIVVDEVVACI